MCLLRYLSLLWETCIRCWSVRLLAHVRSLWPSPPSRHLSPRLAFITAKLSYATAPSSCRPFQQENDNRRKARSSWCQPHLENHGTKHASKGLAALVYTSIFIQNPCSREFSILNVRARPLTPSRYPTRKKSHWVCIGAATARRIQIRQGIYFNTDIIHK